ncbi:MAG: isocitrate/isopropylmalate dehydrogenase family protein [Clostridia bacterium]|nr:isocitrate/isopropylmalate dehydrogenase family protein [Clostridia bacterium]
MKIGVLQGNGIGPEIVNATMRVIDACELGIEWVDIPIAERAIEKWGEPVPYQAIKMAKELKVTLKGPITVEKGKGRVVCTHEDGTVETHCSFNNALRHELNLFVNPRPAKGIPGISGKYEKLDVVVMREISEGIYAAVEHRINGDLASEAVKLITKSGAERLARYSFEYARAHGRKKVTCVHKANAISLTDGLFLECFRRVAAEYPDIESNDYMVDATTYYLVKDPGRFDVIATMNQYGDILSDLCAGLIGSLGLGAGGNIGEEYSMFEACHGSAPDIAGMNIANPTSLILSGAMMLRHVGYTEAGDLVEKCTREVLSEGKCLTRDLGGQANTDTFTDAVIEKIRKARNAQ